MADPTQNFVPKTAEARMHQESANDLTIASAVKGTHSSSTLYTDFDNLRTNCNSDLIDSTNGGTQSITPNSFDDFRGYPKPTLTMNYEKLDVGAPPAAVGESVVCSPTMNNKLGFAITFTVTVEEELIGAEEGIDIHNETFTFNEGSTTPDSSSIGLFIDGKYLLTDNAPTIDYDLSVDVYANGSTHDAYRPGENTFSDTLVYTAQELAYSHTLTPNVSSLNCANSGSGGSTTYYSDDEFIGVNTVIYTNNLLTTPLSTAEIWEEGVSTPSAGRLLIDMNSSGVVTSTLFCPDA